MKKKRKGEILVLILLFTMMFISCGEEMEVEIDIPGSSPRLVINSTLVPSSLPGLKFLDIEVSSSKQIFDTLTDHAISDATVLLYKNDVFVDTLKYNADHGSYPLGYGSFEGPKTGDKYEIEISAPGFENVAAQTTIPGKVEILDTNVVPVAFIDELGGVWSEISLTFKDLPNMKNFYEIVVAETGNFYNSESYNRLFTNESIITGESYYPSPIRFDLKEPKFLLFNDSSFNGEEKTISFFYYPIQEQTDVRYIIDHILNIQLRNVTEDYYRYRTTFLQSLYHHQEDFLYGMGEPFNVFTNVENGYGIFAGFNEDIIEITIEETVAY